MRPFFVNSFSDGGQLLTGDINLKKKKVMRDLRSFFGFDLFRVNVVQCPHHGSKKNWNNSILKGSKKSLVISAGILNRYGHPNFDIESNRIITGHTRMFWCNELNKITIIYK